MTNIIFLTIIGIVLKDRDLQGEENLNFPHPCNADISL